MRLDAFTEFHAPDHGATWRRVLAAGRTAGFDRTLQMWLITGPHNPALRLVDKGSAAFVPEADDDIRNRWGEAVAGRATRLVVALDRSPADLIEHYADHLPLLAVLDIIGVPVADREHIVRWSGDVARLLGAASRPEQQLIGAHAVGALRTYFEQLIVDRIAGRAGAGGLLDDLRRRDDRDEQVAALILHLALSTWIPATQAITDVMDSGLAEPIRWARISADESYRSSLIDISLRREPSDDGHRVAATDFVVDGVSRQSQ